MIWQCPYEVYALNGDPISKLKTNEKMANLTDSFVHEGCLEELKITELIHNNQNIYIHITHLLINKMLSVNVIERKMNNKRYRLRARFSIENIWLIVLTFHSERTSELQI